MWLYDTSSNLMAEAKPKTEIEEGSKSYFCGMNDILVTMQAVPKNPYFNLCFIMKLTMNYGKVFN